VFNLQGIRKHVKRAHDLSLDGYRETYSAFTGGARTKKGRPTKLKEVRSTVLKQCCECALVSMRIRIVLINMFRPSKKIFIS
jgi:hypothetical protein